METDRTVEKEKKIIGDKEKTIMKKRKTELLKI